MKIPVGKTFYSNGKLLLTGEYVVLDGALSLAIPTSFGQKLLVSPSEKNMLHWKSLDCNNTVWFEGKFKLKDGSLKAIRENKTSKTLLKILQKALEMNPAFLSTSEGWEVVTNLDFHTKWGLGSSSTLINNIAQWAKVDAFKLLEASFGGSGYDIAVAQHNVPVLYQKTNEQSLVTEVELPWTFTDQLFFVHLNRKQDSKKGIEQYRAVTSAKKEGVTEISEITEGICTVGSLSEFIELMQTHERIISRLTGLPMIKLLAFNDYPGLVKSLGAWGGDFILVTGNMSAMDYFRRKGYDTIISFSEMIK